jgi:hypothetical protein
LFFTDKKINTFMTLQEMKQLIADTDAKIAKQSPASTEVKQMDAMATAGVAGIEITAAITIGITVLSAVKLLLWWKPSWQNAIGNVIMFLQTFETVTGA